MDSENLLSDGITPPSQTTRAALARLTRLAARLLRAPVSLVTLVEADRQIILGETGLGEPWKTRGEMPLAYSYCQFAASSAAPLLIPDAREDERVRDSPALWENNSIAYAGIPLSYGGAGMGTLCVVDHVPRQWTRDEVDILQDLADSVLTELRLRAEMRQRERHAQRLDTLGKVAAVVAHDFRNIITAVAGNASILLSDMSEEDPRRIEVEEIQNASARANALVRQLLDFSSDRRTSRSVVDVNRAILNIKPMLQRIIGARYQIDVGVADEPLSISIDRGQLEQVIVNLVVNARDAMPRGGVIHVTTFSREVAARTPTGAPLAAGNYAAFSIKDGGSGIDPELLHRIFEPFVTTKSSNGGTGIGLATCRDIVEDAGGFIEVDSEPGTGARFTVCIPITCHVHT